MREYIFERITWMIQQMVNDTQSIRFGPKTSIVDSRGPANRTGLSYCRTTDRQQSTDSNPMVMALIHSRFVEILFMYRSSYKV